MLYIFYQRGKRDITWEKRFKVKLKKYEVKQKTPATHTGVFSLGM
jgi:hypothetical protein